MLRLFFPYFPQNNSPGSQIGKLPPPPPFTFMVTRGFFPAPLGGPRSWKVPHPPRLSRCESDAERERGGRPSSGGSGGRAQAVGRLQASGARASKSRRPRARVRWSGAGLNRRRRFKSIDLFFWVCAGRGGREGGEEEREFGEPSRRGERVCVGRGRRGRNLGWRGVTQKRKEKKTSTA